MKNFLKVLCLVTLAFNVCYGAVYRTGVAEGSVTYSGGGSGNGSGTNYVYIYTNGMPGSEVTNVVAAFTTNKIDNLNGRSTNLFATNFFPVGDIKASNTSLLTWHRDNTNTSHITYFSFGDNGGATLRSWGQTVSTNSWTFSSRQSVGKDHIRLHRNNTGNLTLGDDINSTTTNSADLRVAGSIYLPVPSGTATNLTLDPNGKIVAVTNAPGGGSGSQTPWTQDIDANYFSVSNIANVIVSGLLQGRYARLFPTNGLFGLTISPSTGAGTLVQVTDTNTAAALYVTPNGNVGIKTNAPAAALEVQGNVNVSGNQTNTGSIVSGAGFLHPSSGSFINANGAVAGTFSILNKSTLTSAADGQFTIANNGGNNFTRLNFGLTTAASPSLGRTNGHLAVFGATGLFAGGNTNGLWMMGGPLIQDFNLVSPGAPDRQGALYWNDGTNVIVTIRNSAGVITTNKLSMSAWP